MKKLFLAIFLYQLSWLFSDAAVIIDAAESLTQTLSEKQREKVFFKMSDPERVNWHFFPKERSGLSLKELNKQQVSLVHSLLDSLLSNKGHEKVKNIIYLEQILFELEGKATRDKELYFLSFFGKPSLEEPWGIRFEGHHLSLNFVLRGQRVISLTPNFWGANPSKIPHGPKKGLRAMKEEEDFGKELYLSLSESQKRKALIQDKAFKDIRTKVKAKVDPLKPKGISYKRLNKDQQLLLKKIVMVYLGNMENEIAKQRLDSIEEHGWKQVGFAWAGGSEAGKGHYYAIQGKSFLIEYHNARSKARHIHAVWRDFNGDFGRDVLAEHYQSHSH